MDQSKTRDSGTVTIKLDIVDAKTMRELSEVLGLSPEKIAGEVLGLWLQEQRVVLTKGESWIMDTLQRGWGISLHPLT